MANFTYSSMGYKCHILFIACKDFSKEEGENIRICMLYYCTYYFETLITQVGLAKLYCSICQCIAEIVNDFYFIFFLLSRRKHFYLSCAKLFSLNQQSQRIVYLSQLKKNNLFFKTLSEKFSNMNIQSDTLFLIRLPLTCTVVVYILQQKFMAWCCIYNDHKINTTKCVDCRMLYATIS